MQSLDVLSTLGVPTGIRTPVYELRIHCPWPARRWGRDLTIRDSRALRGSNSHHPIESRGSRPLDEGRVEPAVGVGPTSADYETATLPLRYTGNAQSRRRDLEP